MTGWLDVSRRGRAGLWRQLGWACVAAGLWLCVAGKACADRALRLERWRR